MCTLPHTLLSSLASNLHKVRFTIVNFLSSDLLDELKGVENGSILFIDDAVKADSELVKFPLSADAVVVFKIEVNIFFFVLVGY